MGTDNLPTRAMAYIKEHPVLSAVGVGVSTHVVVRVIVRAVATWCASEGIALAQDIEHLATATPTHAVPVGDFSWPAVILALGYMLKGWSPAITVRVVSAKDSNDG